MWSLMTDHSKQELSSGKLNSWGKVNYPDFDLEQLPFGPKINRDSLNK